MKIPISSILIGDRVRKDMGDIKSLADSIKRHGLMHPVVVRTNRALEAGERRIEAAKLIGWQDIEATVVDIEDMLSAQRDENSERKDFSPTESVEMGRKLEEQHRAKIAEQEQRRKAMILKTPEIFRRESAGDTRDIVGAALGMSGPTYVHARAVVAAAESDPEKFGDLPAKMDESGNVNGTYREMKRRKAGAKPDSAFTGKRPKRQGFRNDRSAPYDPKSKGQIQRAESQKRRLINSLSIVNGHCRGLAEFDVPMAISVCNKQEIKTWEKKARDLSRTLRKLADKLKTAAKK